MLAAGSLISSATVVRVGLGCCDLWAKKAPTLMRRAVDASLGTAETERAQAELRDDLIALARESGELSYREMRRAVDDFDKFTRPRDQPGTKPFRPYRAKL
jgi:hypothetical protein